MVWQKFSIEIINFGNRTWIQNTEWRRTKWVPGIANEKKSKFLLALKNERIENKLGKQIRTKASRQRRNQELECFASINALSIYYAVTQIDVTLSTTIPQTYKKVFMHSSKFAANFTAIQVYKYPFIECFLFMFWFADVFVYQAINKFSFISW